MTVLAKIISTGLFVGYIPVASGTFGSVLGCGLWVFVAKQSYYYSATGLLLILGFFTSGYAEREVFRKKDDRRIVIDEICGMLIAFMTHSFTFTVNGFVLLTAGLIIFRIFDIIKPQPIKYIQNLKGSSGIMLDDIAAGAITNGMLHLIKLVTRRFS
jgi:phosphatidylglycerophosphatase A